jgi:hypothetical protein
VKSQIYLHKIKQADCVTNENGQTNTEEKHVKAMWKLILETAQKL